MELLIQREKSNTIESYEYIIQIIIDKYLEYCDEWYKICNNNINLKKKCIKDIYKNGELTEEFENYIDTFNYIAEELNFEILECIADRIEFSNSFKFTSRIKTRESLMQKILKKMNDGGNYPIIKNINDILGVRIIDSEFNEKKIKIEEYLESLKRKGYKIRNVNRDLEIGYKAYHIYISGNNNTFPIEIQIWDRKDENNNIKLHSLHKEAYLVETIKRYHKY